MQINFGSHRRQRGALLFMILLAVVLFAALSYAVTQSIRSGGKDGSSEGAEAKAATIIQYATLIENTFTRLKLRGCTIDQISFEAPAAIAIGLNHANPRAPSDKRCHMFDPAGGGVNYQSFADNYLVTTQSGNTADNGVWAIRGHPQFHGTADSPVLSGIPDGSALQIGDTIMVIRFISDAICQKISANTTPNKPHDMYTLHLLGPFTHRANTGMDIFNVNVDVRIEREGCFTNGNFGTTVYSRTAYWRIISVN